MSRFVKARELIKEDKRTVYVISEEVYLNLDEACLQAATSKVYESLRKKYILHHSISKWDKECIDLLNRRSKKIATRLEREFLRGEEDRVLTIIFDTDGCCHPKNILHIAGAIRSSDNLDFLMYQLGYWSCHSSKSIFTELFHENSKHKCVIRWDEDFNDFSLIALERVLPIS